MFDCYSNTSIVLCCARRAPVKCIVRNYSETGAKIEAHSPVPATFDLVFDLDKARRSCRVVWRKGTLIGVKFL